MTTAAVEWARTRVAGVEHVKPAVVAHQRRPFHQRAFPLHVVAKQLGGFADEGRALVVQALCPDGRVLVAGVAVFFPDEVEVAVLIRHREAVDGAGLLAHQRAVVEVGAGGVVGAGYRHAQHAALLAGGVVQIGAAILVIKLRGPEVRTSPVGCFLGENVAHQLPVEQVFRAENREYCAPFGRSGAGPVGVANFGNGWVGEVAGQYHVVVADAGRGNGLGEGAGGEGAPGS